MKHKSQFVYFLPGNVSQHSSEPIQTIVGVAAYLCPSFDTHLVPFVPFFLFSLGILNFSIVNLSHSYFVSCFLCLQCCLYTYNPESVTLLLTSNTK